jgi:L,D-transpeptidase catalytic domain
MVAIALLMIGLLALGAAAGLVAASQFGEEDNSEAHGFIPDRSVTLTAPRPSEAQRKQKARRGPCYSTAHVRRATTLYRRPGGRRRLKLAKRTEWGSPRFLGVVQRREGWLGVQAAELPNGEVAWLRRSQARLGCSRWSLHVDLSKRRLLVQKDGKRIRKLTVAVGRPANPTPQGRFTVSDKLRVSDQSSPYGCCVLALTGHQTNLPAGWPGGDRLAVHATTDTWSIGQPVSSGCMRTDERQARWLIHTIPLGAPIFIRA